MTRSAFSWTSSRSISTGATEPPPPACVASAALDQSRDARTLGRESAARSRVPVGRAAGARATIEMFVTGQTTVEGDLLLTFVVTRQAYNGRPRVFVMAHRSSVLLSGRAGAGDGRRRETLEVSRLRTNLSEGHKKTVLFHTLSIPYIHEEVSRGRSRGRIMAKRRGRNEGSIYERTDGRWAGSIDLGFIDGKRVRKTFYGETRNAVAISVERCLRAPRDRRNHLHERRDRRRPLPRSLVVRCQRAAKDEAPIRAGRPALPRAFARARAPQPARGRSGSRVVNGLEQRGLSTDSHAGSRRAPDRARPGRER